MRKDTQTPWAETRGVPQIGPQTAKQPGGGEQPVEGGTVLCQLTYFQKSHVISEQSSVLPCPDPLGGFGEGDLLDSPCSTQESQQ